MVMNKLKYKISSFGFSKEKSVAKTSFFSYSWHRNLTNILPQSEFTQIPGISKQFTYYYLDYDNNYKNNYEHDNEIIKPTIDINDSSTEIEQKEAFKRYLQEEQVILPLPDSIDCSPSYSNIEQNEEQIEKTEEDQVDIMVHNILSFTKNEAGFSWHI